MEIMVYETIGLKNICIQLKDGKSMHVEETITKQQTEKVIN